MAAVTSCENTLLNFTCANKSNKREATYRRSRVNVKVERNARPFQYIASVLFMH